MSRRAITLTGCHRGVIGVLWWDGWWPETPWRALPIGATRGMPASSEAAALAWLVGMIVEGEGMVDWSQHAQPIDAILALDLDAIDDADVEILSPEEWEIIVRQRSAPPPEWIRRIRERAT